MWLTMRSNSLRINFLLRSLRTSRYSNCFQLFFALMNVSWLFGMWLIYFIGICIIFSCSACYFQVRLYIQRYLSGQVSAARNRAKKRRESFAAMAASADDRASAMSLHTDVEEEEERQEERRERRKRKKDKKKVFTS